MSTQEQVSLVAMNDDGVFDTTGDQPGKPLAVTGLASTSVPTLLMPKLLAEHLDRGLVISLPKIKAHRFSVVSLAIKGLQGTVMYSDRAPGYRQKWRSHRELGPYLAARKRGDPETPTDRDQYVAALEAFAERMTDVLALEAPHVVLAEGAPFMGGDGFHELIPGSESVAIGGTNPILVDRVGAELLGLWNHPILRQELGGHHTSPLIETAATRFGVNLDEVVIRGDGAALVNALKPIKFTSMAPFSIDFTPPEANLPATAEAVHNTGDQTDVLPHTAASSSKSAATRIPQQPMALATAIPNDALIDIDGRADEDSWRNTSPLSWNTDYAGKVTDINTRVRFLWSPKALYVLFELDSTGLNTDHSRSIVEEHRELYREDCVELFLVPNPNRPNRYYEIELGPYGHWFDLELDRERPRQPGKSRAASMRDLDWSSGLRIATSQDPKSRTATIEVALTSPDIVRLLRPDATFPLGLYRIEGTAPKRYLAWSPPLTSKPKFHVPESFGRLTLLPAPQ